MTEYLDHIAIARQLLEQQGEINRLTAELEQTEISFEQRGQTITRLEGKLQTAEMQLAELNNAITWETTCLKCSRLLSRSYDDYCRAEALTEVVLAVANELTQSGVHDAAGRLSDALDRYQETASAAPEFPLPIRPDGTHYYVSTGCGCTGDRLMPDGRTGHQYCQGMTGLQGAKRGGQAKCCGAPCQCPCHQDDRCSTCGTRVEPYGMVLHFRAEHATAEDLAESSIDDPEPTREELQALVDDQGLDLYRAQDLIAFVREMCDAADADGSPVTTERVRGWLGYTGCGGVLVLPEAVQQQVREALGAPVVMAAELMRAPTTPDGPTITAGFDPDIEIPELDEPRFSIEDDKACECGHYRTSHRAAGRWLVLCHLCSVLRVDNPYRPFAPLLRTPAAQASAPDCRWPACLSEDDQQVLAGQVEASMLGEETALMPDPRPGCGCVDRGLDAPAVAGPATGSEELR